MRLKARVEVLENIVKMLSQQMSIQLQLNQTLMELNKTLSEQVIELKQNKRRTL